MVLKNKIRDKNKRIILVIVFIALACVLTFIYWYRVNSSPKDLSNATSIGANTKGEPEQSDQKKDNDSTDTQNHKKDSSDDSVSPDKPVKKPIGNFVSSHEVSMDSMIASSCVTTIGIQCTINFTRDGITKSLKSQTTDREGATFWEWTPKRIGLSKGTWEVEAIASNGIETQTAKDAISLEVR